MVSIYVFFTTYFVFPFPQISPKLILEKFVFKPQVIGMTPNLNPEALGTLAVLLLLGCSSFP